MTAIVKYDFMASAVLFQYRYSHDAVTSFATSNTTPIARIGSAAAGKIAMRPTIEKYPATVDTANAENSKSAMNNILVSTLWARNQPEVLCSGGY